MLLVEDEILVRMAGADMVTDLGHTVHEAGSAEEALRVLEQERVDVVITDIGLPGISGMSLVAQVQERWPAIRIVIASGYTRPPDAADTLGDSVRWLSKPFDLTSLGQVLEN